MKFSAVSIRRSNQSSRLEVHFWDLPGDRSCKSPQPHSNGFYYYPRSTSPYAAFLKLKSCLINHLEKEMKRIGEDLEELRSLEAKSTHTEGCA